MRSFSKFQERYCLTWKTDINEHKVRNINFGSYNLILEIQPKICQSIVYIFLYQKDESCCTFDVKTCVLNKAEKEVFEQCYKGSLKNGPTIWYMKRSELLKEESVVYDSQIFNFKFEINPKDELLERTSNVSDDIECFAFRSSTISEENYGICCDSDVIEKTVGYVAIEEPLQKEQHQLSLDFSKLFDNEEDSDVILECGDRQIKAHRCILSARSDVFTAMFRSEMLENQNGVVTIEDVTPEVLELMVRYIYCGQIENVTVETVSKLYKVADKYNIESLKTRCVCLLKENLSDISACDILLLADTYDDKKLENLVVDFLAKNGASLCTDQWVKFCEEHPTLGIKVYQRFTREQPRSKSGLRFKPY